VTILNKKIKYIIVISLITLITIVLITIVLILNNNVINTKSETAKTIEGKVIPQPKCSHDHSYFLHLNDSVHQYIKESFINGIGKNLVRAFEINNYVKTGSLILIKPNTIYTIDTLKYSYPYLTPKAKRLLTEIGRRFQLKIKNTNLSGTRIIVTSALRTINKIKQLKRGNKNAVINSPHLHGTTFDITYKKYNHQNEVTLAEIEGLSEILSKTLFELRLRKKCWVTFESFQCCFHIVSR